MEHNLLEIGKKLENPPRSKKALLNILQKAAGYLSEVEQSPSAAVLMAMKTSIRPLIRTDIFQHNDMDVRLLVAACISEIMRVTAPDTPFSDDVLREIFQLIVAIFHELHDINGISFARIVAILETVAKVRSCVLMLDLQCDDLILKMFNKFFSIAREDHPESVLASMQTIMISVLDESEIVSEKLLYSVLSRLRKGNRECCPAAYRMAMNVVKCLAGKLKQNVHLLLASFMSAERKSESNLNNDYDEIIFSLYECAPEMLQSLIPDLTQVLLTDQLGVRLNYVNLVGRILSIPGPLSEEFQPLISDFLKRFGDKAVEVRLAVVEHAKECLLSNPFRPDAPCFIAALGERLLDFEEVVRKHVVAAICDVAKCTLKTIPSDTIRLVADCLHDKMVSVRNYTLEKLAEVYRVYCSNCLGESVGNFVLDWIPGEVLRSCYDKDFRPQTVEMDFFESIYPYDLPLAERVKHWVTSFSQLEEAEVKALEKILAQKQRFQLEMQSFLSFWEKMKVADFNFISSWVKMKGDESPELQSKIFNYFRNMSGSFEYPAKAEESYLSLSKINDDDIWKALSSLLDPSLSFIQAQSTYDDLLKRFGERHPLYEFMKILATRCSYLLFGKEHVKEILNKIAVNKLAGNDKIVSSSMNLLVLFAGIFPSIAEGSEKDLIQLLENDNEQIKEGVVRILAKTGGIIHENMFEISGSADFLLEKLCLEGSRKQAKYAVQAIATITKDSGHNALSALYKRLVDMLESGQHLATILQSLGCIAQIAMPVFETEEEKVIQFVCRKLLRKISNPIDVSKMEWEDRSEICFLKICGIKTLIKSYLPKKDAQLRKRIKALFGVLTKLISVGEISEDVKSSKVDKAHLRLASATAVLRLSMHWDSHITPQLFHFTLRTAQDVCPYVRKQFLAKVHRYLKDRTIDIKYACTFVLSTPVATKHEILQARQYLAEFIETSHQDTQLSQPYSNSYEDSLTNVLSYLIHTLAHHPDFSVSDYGSRGEAFKPFYQQLHFFLSVVLQQDQSRQFDSKGAKKLESIPLFMAIFRTIKRLEDAVDKSKSENLYTLCDLGIWITKDLTGNEVNIGSGPMSISFPSYYTTSEGSEDIHLKVDGSHLPPCLLSDDVLKHFKAASICQRAEFNHDQKQCGNVDENGANERENGESKAQFLKRTSRKRHKQNSKEYVSGETTNPEMVKEQLDYRTDTYNKTEVLSEFEDKKWDKGLESTEALEQPEEQSKSKILEMVPSEVKSAGDNVMMSVEVSDAPKRRRGRPCKVAADNVSQGQRQGIVGKGSNGFKLARPKLRHERIYGYKENVEKETQSPDSKLIGSESAANGLSKVDLVHQSDTEGCFKSLGKRSNSEGKIKLPDLTTVDTEKVSHGLLGGELTHNALQVEENTSSGHFSGKDLRKRLISSQDKTSKTMKQSKSTRIEVLPNEINSADDYMTMSVAEPSFPPKRKRGRPSRGTTNFVSQRYRQGKAGNDSNLLKMCQRKRRHESSDYTSDVQRETELPDSKLVTSEITQDGLSETALIPLNVLDTYKMKKDELSKKLTEFPSSDQQQRPSENFSNCLEIFQCRRGQPQSLGQRSNSKGKIKLSDSTTVVERISHGLLGSELNPSNMQLDENKDCGQNLAKSLNSRLDASHDKFSEKLIPNGVKTAENNVTTVVAEASASSKRKRGQLSKGTADFTSQDTRQGLAGKDSNLLKTYQPKCWNESPDYKSDVQRDTELPDSKLVTSEIEQGGLYETALIPLNDLDTYKVKQDEPSKKLSELHFSDQQQGLSESFSNCLEFSQRRRGRPKGLGQRSNSKRKIKLPDSTTVGIEKVSAGLLGSELNPAKMQLEENKGSGQNLAKSVNNRLDANHDFFSEKLIPNGVKTAENNIMMVVAEASVSSKRKRGQLSKGTADLTSQDTRQGLSGMDSNDLKLSQPKQGHQISLGYEADVKKSTESPHSKLATSEIAADGVSNIALMSHTDELIKRIFFPPKRSSMRLNKLYSKSSEKAKHEEYSKKSDEMPGQFICHDKASKIMKQCTVVEEMPNDVKSVDDNLAISVAEAPFPHKRKRGRPSKTTADLAPQGNTQGFIGNDSNGLKSSQPMRRHQKILAYKLAVQKEMEPLDLKLIESGSAADGLSGAALICDANELINRNKVSSRNLRKLCVKPSYKAKQEEKQKKLKGVPEQHMVAEFNCTYERKEDHSSKISSELHSAEQKKCLPERSPKDLEFSHSRRGRPKGLGKRLNLEGKTMLRDLKIVTAQRAPDEILGVEFPPSNRQSEENKGSEQSKTKNLKKRLGPSHDQLSKTMDNGSAKVQGPGSKPENGSLHNEMHGNPSDSIKKQLHKNGYNIRGTPENQLNRQSISEIEKRPSGKFEKKDVQDLVGQKIKVWWPLDKKFYIGVVDSYDTNRKKHKIIYHDGDVEMLSLQKERWERIDGNAIPRKFVKTY